MSEHYFGLGKGAVNPCVVEDINRIDWIVHSDMWERRRWT